MMKKKSRDKPHLKRVYNMEAPTFVFYILNLPSLIVKTIIAAIRKEDMTKPIKDLRMIAMIRKQVISYKKKRGAESEKVKLLYDIGTYCIEIYVLFQRRMTVSEYDNLAETCATITQRHTTEVSRKYGYYSFMLYEDPQPKKKIIVDQKKHEICIGQDYHGSVMWDFDTHSCCLIAGKPRNGKSSMIMYMLNSLVTANWDIWMIDGKDVDYIGYTDYFKEYVGNDDLSLIIDLITRFHQQMVDRYALMKEHKVNKYGKLGLNPIFLICDEYLSVIERIKKSCKKDEYERMIYMIGDIVRRGPAGGVQLILGMQRADTVYIPGEMRSNMQLKIVVGDGGKELYKMMFEDEADLCEKVNVGYGWYRMGSAPTTFAIPFYEDIEATHDKTGEPV